MSTSSLQDALGRVSLLDVALGALLIAAALTDASKARVPNWLTYPALAFGLSWAIAGHGWRGLLVALAGLAAGFLPFLALYLTGGLGGGDVKLMAAVGAMVGFPLVINAMITSILVGGLLGLLLATWEGKLLASFRFVGLTLLRVIVPSVTIPALGVRRNLPFGVAISLGTFIALIADRSGYSTPAALLGLG